MFDHQHKKTESRDLRVGLVHWAFPPTTGGVESHLADLALFLHDAGCIITVITGEENPVTNSSIEIVSSPLLNLHRIRSEFENDSLYPEKLRTFFSELLEAKRLNIIHGHNLHHFSAQPAIILDQLRQTFGFKMHHTFHETWPDILQDTPLYRTWEENYAVSKFVQKECERRIGFRPTLLPLGIDTTRFSTTRSCLSRNDQPVILHPARLLPWKGTHISVQMLAKLRHQGIDAKLVLTDTQKIIDWKDELSLYRKEVIDLISTLKLQNFIEFRPIQYAAMPTLYEEADIVIYPTVGDEPYGLVPLEAMSARRPIIASASGGITETVVDGQTGFLFSRGNVMELTNHVSNLLQHPDLARRIGGAGRSHVSSHYDIRHYVSTLLANYQT